MTFIKAVSKWLHKYIGLLLILFLAWMSISGILLNHPEIIQYGNVPHYLIPEEYKIVNWHRGALSDVCFSSLHTNTIVVSGKEGVWISQDSGKSFESYMNGDFPDSRYYRKTNDLLLVEQNGVSTLYACTYGGLFKTDLSKGYWERILLPVKDEQPMAVFTKGDTLIVCTKSHFFASRLNKGTQLQSMAAARNGREQVTLVKLFFDLHSGKVLGLPGKLLYDIVGIILLVLCITAFYTWYYPKKLRWKVKTSSTKRRKNNRIFLFLLKYHLQFGIWSALILLIISGTGLFMRPPLLAALAQGTVPSAYYPGILPDNPWHDKIRNATYDSVRDRILVDCTDGVYTGKADFSEPFYQVHLPIPVFVMGATVMNVDSTGSFIIGSFNGLFKLDIAKQSAVDLISGTEPGYVSPLRPGKDMATGYFVTPDGAEYLSTHNGGLRKLRGNSQYGDFTMPEAMSHEYKLSLWNYMFELHNGRLFQGIIGDWYILLVPLGALLSFILTITGIIDWIVVTLKKTKK